MFFARQAIVIVCNKWLESHMAPIWRYRTINSARIAGEVVSELARAGLRAAMAAPSSAGADKSPSSFFGFRPFSPRGAAVTNDIVNKLRDESGV
jgi:hypothetical protein